MAKERNNVGDILSVVIAIGILCLLVIGGGMPDNKAECESAAKIDYNMVDLYCSNIGELCTCFSQVCREHSCESTDVIQFRLKEIEDGSRK